MRPVSSGSPLSPSEKRDIDVHHTVHVKVTVKMVVLPHPVPNVTSRRFRCEYDFTSSLSSYAFNLIVAELLRFSVGGDVAVEPRN